MLSPKILYVEDDDDIRSVVTQALSGEGFDVNAVSSAEDALRDLESSSFDVMLTDYRLPRENAAWLLREGKARGCLGNMPVIVFSAEQSPEGIEGYTFLRKPIDLDVLSAAIAKALSTTMPPDARTSDTPAHAPKLSLTLYVTTSSHVSQKAIRNLHRIISKFDESRIRLKISDVLHPSRDSLPGQSIDEDRIVVTPTLVVRVPGPKVWIAGDLSDSSMVEGVINHGLKTLALDSA
jgi:DNA-binding NtrC family response regulator